MKQIINLFLLTVMFFTVTHEVVYAQHADEHCTPQEYIAEFATPDVHEDEHEHENDACETHYLFHISFLLPENFSLYELRQDTFALPFLSSTNHFYYQKNTFRPPIV